MVSASVMVGRGERSWTTRGEGAVEKSIVSGPGLVAELAARMACRREPGPSSRELVTRMVAGAMRASRASTEERRRIGRRRFGDFIGNVCFGARSWGLTALWARLGTFQKLLSAVKGIPTGPFG